MKSSVSLIILAYNDSHTIKRCLESVFQQTNLESYDIEILFVPNGCTDDTREKGQNLFETNKSLCRYQIFELPRGHRTAALNFGLQKSTGQYVIYLNADSYLAPNAISLLLSSLKNGIVLCGCKDICDPSNIKKDTLLYKYATFLGEIQKNSTINFPNGRCMGFKKGLVTKFPENIHSEDNWIDLKIYQEYGYDKILKSGEVYFQIPSNWLDFIQLSTRWFLGTKQLLETFPEMKKIFDALMHHEGMLKDKEHTKKLAIESLKNQGYTQDEIEKLHRIHLSLNNIVEDNGNNFSKKLVQDDGTWVTDR